MTDTIPYTHWSYFPDKASAETCGKELEFRFDTLTLVTPAVDPTPGQEWLLLASRPVELGTDWHAPVEAVVERHGGFYDGGESGWMDFTPHGVVYLEAEDGPR